VSQWWVSTFPLQLALNVAQLGSYQYDPLRRMFSGDARSQEIFDFPKAEAGIDEILKLVHPDDVEMVQANLEAALDPIDPRRSTTEFRLRRAHGEVRWVETLGLAYFEGDGPERRAVSFVGTLQDITERKEREDKERLLMREINHRAKNMLSVVHAIARQTAAKNSEDFIKRFSERRRFQPITTCLSETNGMASRLRTWFAPNSLLSPTLLVLVSRCTAPSCA
jgi:PAS domain S-box-containing protein